MDEIIDGLRPAPEWKGWRQDFVSQFDGFEGVGADAADSTGAGSRGARSAVLARDFFLSSFFTLGKTGWPSSLRGTNPGA